MRKKMAARRQAWQRQGITSGGPALKCAKTNLVSARSIIARRRCPFFSTRIRERDSINHRGRDLTGSRLPRRKEEVKLSGLRDGLPPGGGFTTISGWRGRGGKYTTRISGPDRLGRNRRRRSMLAIRPRNGAWGPAEVSPSGYLKIVPQVRRFDHHSISRFAISELVGHRASCAGVPCATEAGAARSS